MVLFSCDPELWRLCKLNLGAQVMMLFFASMILDGGMMLQGVAFSSAIYWVFNIIILVRRPNTPTKLDLMVARIGFFLGIPIGFITMPIWGWLRG